jgi:hypothetical protein
VLAELEHAPPLAIDHARLAEPLFEQLAAPCTRPQELELKLVSSGSVTFSGCRWKMSMSNETVTSATAGDGRLRVMGPTAWLQSAGSRGIASRPFYKTRERADSFPSPGPA